MLALSPRAVERLLSYKPAWPLPKIFRLTSGGKLIEGIFKGETINTPSMLCVEDALDGLRWAERVGGLPGLIARSEANLAAIAAWVAERDWVAFLAEDAGDALLHLDLPEDHRALVRGAGRGGRRRRRRSGSPRCWRRKAWRYDIASYRDAPPGLRIWGGATVETADIAALLPWLDWSYAQAEAAFTKQDA